MPERKLAVIDVKAGAAMESQSGLQMNQPKIYGAYEEPEQGSDTAALIMHPTSNFMGHYLITPLAQRGITCMGLNSRYVGNDVTLEMERVIQDLGAGVQFLKNQGYRKIILIGNSGGASLASFYQAQAENLTISHTPAGDPINIKPADLPPVDAIILSAAHAGRSQLMSEWIDPAVCDERDPSKLDSSLDCYHPDNQPYTEEFLTRFRQAQLQRQQKLENWCKRRLEKLAENPHGPQNEAFIVHRTHADPRMIDLSLDSNDRARGSIWGEPAAVNSAANAMGRFTTLKAFLSQWALCSNADGPSNLAKTSVPVLLFDHSGDSSTFPSTIQSWQQAYRDRGHTHKLSGANHYLLNQPKLVEEAADKIRDFAQTVYHGGSL